MPVETLLPDPGRPRPRSARRLLAALGAACIVLASVTGAAAAGASDAVVLDRHHTDAMSVRYEDGGLVLKTRADLDSGAGQVLDPDDVLFHVTDRQKDVIPDIPAFAFLGEPGAPIWRISQSYLPGVLWAGWETESLPRGTFVNEQVRLELQGITGPGRVELYLNDLEGPARLWSSTDPARTAITEWVGAHTHANWVFTEPGAYVFTVVAEGDLVAGGTVRSAPQSYTFLVGSEDEEPDPEPTGPEEPAEPGPSPSESPSPSPTDPGPSPSPTTPGEEDPADEEPAEEDPTVAPESALAAPDAGALTEAVRGGVSLSAPNLAPGGQVTVTVPGAPTGHWLSAWLLSDPVDLGWKQVNAEGAFAIAVPPGTVTGDHRLVVRDRAGALIGWTPLAVVVPEQAVEECIPTPVTVTVRPDTVDVLTGGHFDFGPMREGAALRAMVKDDRAAPPMWVDPGTLVFHLGDAAAGQAPGGQFSFLGSGTVWQIPLTQQSGVPWLGWNTQHPTVAGNAQGPITLTLDNLSGPGDLAVYSVDSWGQMGEQYFGTVGGFPRSTSIEVGAAGVHVHGIWAFTQPGAYHADLTFSGTIGGQRMSGTSTLTFFVGPGDPRSAVRERTVTTYVGRTASGAECQLTLAQTGDGNPRMATDLAGLAGASLLVGLAFLGASALAPRHGGARLRTR